MNINKQINGSAMEIALSGRLDTTTAPDLEKTLKDSLDGITELTLDLKELDYISSAGLRVLLSAQKVMTGDKSMKLVNVGESIMEVFEVTGFSEILTIE